jgi:hypothetical protein
MTATPPNGQTDGHADCIIPPGSLAHPVNYGLQGLFILDNSSNTTPDAPDVRNTTNQPIQPPHHPHTTPTPTSPMWKSPKSASMSLQHRRMALSASNDVAGTRKCFFAAFSSATCSSITPLRRHDITFTPNAHEDLKHAGGQKPPAIFRFFKPPNHSTTHGTNKYNPQGPHTTEVRSENAKMPPLPLECASALPGDIGDGSGTIMCPILTAPTPRESNGTPWGVSRRWGHRKCQNTRVVKNHPRVSCTLRSPSTSAVNGTNIYSPRTPHAAENRCKNTERPPASPKSASALPGDVSDDRAPLYARFRRRQPPGSPIGLPGEFHVHRSGENGRNAGAACFFAHAASAIILYVL